MVRGAWSGDYTPDMAALLGADVIIATPEKWDGISRAWAHRAYVQRVVLLILDEIHLLGADRWDGHCHSFIASCTPIVDNAKACHDVPKTL